MRKLVRNTLLLASAVALALTGCRPPMSLVRPNGPGFVGTAGVGAGTPEAPVGYGGMAVNIKWPPPLQRATQAIPAVANTLHLKVSTREGRLLTQRLFNRPGVGEPLTSSANLTVGVGSSLIVEVNAYREQIATESELPTAERIIAQGTQENVTITLNATTSVRLALDPDVTIAGKGGAASLGLRTIPWSLIDNDPRGPAIWTELNTPEHLVYDPVGKYLYFTERPDAGRLTEGYRIMRLSLVSTPPATETYGVMTLVAGGAQVNTGRLSEDAQAPFTPISSLRSVTTDASGNTYFVEAGTSNRVRKLAGTTTSTFVQGFSAPEAVYAHGSRVYVADSGNNRVYAYNPTGDLMWTAGGGSDNLDGASTSFIPAASASVPAPTALAAAGDHLYVATRAGRVLDINLTSAESGAASVRTLTAVSGDVPTASAARLDTLTFGALAGIAVSGSDLYVSDTTNRGIWRLPTTPTGNLTLATSRVAGFQGAGLLAGQFTAPEGLLLDGTTLYVCDSGNNRIERIDVSDPNNYTVSHFAGRFDGVGDMIDGPSVYNGDDYATLSGPQALSTRSATTSLVVADSANNRLRGVTTTGDLSTLLGRWSTARLARGVGQRGHNLHLGEIAAMCLYPTPGATAPSLYVLTTDSDDNAGGQAVYRIGGLDNASFGPTDYNLLQVDPVVTTETLFENLLSRIGTTITKTIEDPSGLGINPVTKQVVFSVAGTYHTVLAWDGVNYELAYGYNNLPGVGYLTFAGTGAPGYNGEGPASLVQLNQPRRIRYDRDGNCYFLTLNGSGQTVLRRVGTNGKISTIAGGGSLAVPPVGGSVSPVQATQANLGTVADFDVDSQGNMYLASGTRILRLDQRAATMTEVYSATNRNFTSIAFDENDAAIIFAYAEEPKIKKVYLSRLY